MNESHITHNNQTDHHQTPTRDMNNTQIIRTQTTHMRRDVSFGTEQHITWEEVLIGFPSPLIVSFSTIILLGETQWMPPMPSFTVFPCHQWGWQVGNVFCETARPRNHNLLPFYGVCIKTVLVCSAFWDVFEEANTRAFLLNGSTFVPCTLW